MFILQVASSRARGHAAPARDLVLKDILHLNREAAN
jgi:hypothetical protein